MKTQLALCLTAVLGGGCASTPPPKPEPPKEQPPLTEAEKKKEKKAEMGALWATIQKDMGKDWFEKTESVVWQGITVFGSGVSRYAGTDAKADALEVRGPFFVSMWNFLLWDSAKQGFVKLDRHDNFECSGVRSGVVAMNPFHNPDPYSTNYPWSRLLKARPTPTPTAE